MPSGRQGVSEVPAGGGGLNMGAGQAMAAPILQKTPEAVSALTSLPEARLTPPQAEVQPATELQHQIQAAVTEHMPNPTVVDLTPRPEPAAPAEPPLSKPTYPGKGATLEQKRAYAAQRDAWMAQEAKARPRVALPADVAGKVDASVNRFVKARSADEGEVRQQELAQHMRSFENMTAEEQVKLRDAMRVKAQTATAQAAEARRVAAAPEQIQQLRAAPS
jgi:hypothetical protein